MHEAMREQRPVHFENQSMEGQHWFEHTAYPSHEGLTLYTPATLRIGNMRVLISRQQRRRSSG